MRRGACTKSCGNCGTRDCLHSLPPDRRTVPPAALRATASRSGPGQVYAPTPHPFRRAGPPGRSIADTGDVKRSSLLSLLQSGRSPPTAAGSAAAGRWCPTGNPPSGSQPVGDAGQVMCEPWSTRLAMRGQTRAPMAERPTTITEPTHLPTAGARQEPPSLPACRHELPLVRQGPPAARSDQRRAG